MNDIFMMNGRTEFLVRMLSALTQSTGSHYHEIEEVYNELRRELKIGEPNTNDVELDGFGAPVRTKNDRVNGDVINVYRKNNQELIASISPKDAVVHDDYRVEYSGDGK